MGLVLCAGTAFAAETATWINNTANTPATAYDWNAPGNWEGGKVGGAGYDVTITPSAKVYIKVPDGGVTIHKMLGGTSGANAVLIGGDITVVSVDNIRAEWSSSASVYSTIVLPASETYAQPYLSGSFSFCGQMQKYDGDAWNRPVIASGANKWRFDMFATGAGETRIDEAVIDGSFGQGSGSLMIYGPVGADAVSGTWRLVQGSAYATRVSATAHALAVGTSVTASGYLKAGTYLKRVFDNATIELSEPADVGGDVELSFAAFTPNFTASFAKTYYQQGNYGQYFCYKTRPQDVVRVDFNEYLISGGTTSAGPATIWFGANTDGEQIGTFVFHKVSGSGLCHHIDLKHAHFELAGDGDTHVTEFPAAFPWTMQQKLTATVTVTNGITGIVNVFTNFTGMLVKDGAGFLKIGLGEAANAGSFKVEGGTLQILRNGTVGDGETLSVKALTIRAGATFTMPAGGLTVNTLTVENGAILNGDGELVVLDLAGVTGDALRRLTCTGGAKVRIASGDDEGQMQLAIPEARVVGHPAFWVDASKPETVTTNATGGVTRWNDCRAGEPMFCTNVASAYPTYVCGDTMRKKYVKIAKVSGISELADSQMLVWSVPISGIKAVFLVQDPTDGGGEILGRTASRLPWRTYFGSQGGPYYRGRTWSGSLVANSSYTECVRNGRFFLDGVEVCGYTSGYKGPYLQLVEHHVNTNYPARGSLYDLSCDAFGFGYEQPHSDISDRGGMRIAEYIIYTNSLSHAERLQTAQYLMRKWLGRNVYWASSDTNNVVDVSGTSTVLDVAAGKGLTASTITSGSLVKDGGGLLYVDGLAADALEVRAGEVKVASRNRATEVPHDAIIHVDADDAESITTYDGTDKLKIWMDVNGTGKSLRPVHHYTRADGTFVRGYVREHAINDRPAIDLGAMTNSSSYTSEGLVFYDANGNLPPTRNDSRDAGWEADTVQTAFFVYDSSPGGGCLLGGVGSQWPHKGMPHVYSTDGEKPIFYSTSSFWGGGYNHQALSNACNNGTMLFRRNGEEIHPFKTMFSKGVERVTFQYADGRRCDYIAASQDGYNTGTYCGGFKFGEIILYSRVLSAAEIARVEAYLARKWSGIETPGYGAASADALTVAAGAKVTVLGLPLNTSAISGGGTVDGDISLAANGQITVNVAANGAVECLSVTGAADLAGGGTVTLSGSVPALLAGTYRIMSADTLSFGGAWTVAGGLKSNTYALSVSDNALYLTVAPHGLKFILR